MRKTAEIPASAAKPIVYVPCPVPEGGFAGWERQLRQIAGRNPHRATFRFLYQPERPAGRTGRLSMLVMAVDYALRCRKRIVAENDGATVLFPSFFLQNVLLAVALPHSVPYSVRISGNELTKGNSLTYLLRLAMIRRARHVIALNAEQHARLGEIGVPSARRHLIPVSVSQEYRPPMQSERIAARSALGVSPEDWVIGCVGLICERKQQRTLIAAVAALRRPEAIVILCGPESGGIEADPAYAAACKEDAARLGVRLRMTGRRDDVRAVLWALDVFVLPSLGEGMPNALLEALACGLPCIGSDIPGIRDLLTASDRQQLFPVKNPLKLAQVLAATRSPYAITNTVDKYRGQVVDEKIIELLT